MTKKTMSSPPIDKLYHDQNLAQFYDLINDWAADQDYCLDMAKSASSVLDLGCGTGRFLVALPSDIHSVGVDPAPAMLNIARNRQNGDRVKWVEGDARTIRLDAQFDLIVMTGHAFQCFLHEEDQLALLRTIADHLSPTGRFIFDMRNPLLEAWREWSADTDHEFINHPELGAIKMWHDIHHDSLTAIVTYDSHYQIVETGETFHASSQIVFTPKDVLLNRIHRAGLEVGQWLGSWEGEEYTEFSKEIIAVGNSGKSKNS